MKRLASARGSLIGRCFLSYDERTDARMHISDLAHFIASGRLQASINKVHDIVETTRPSLKNAQYKAVVKQGDILLNEVQRLSEVLY